MVIHMPRNNCKGTRNDDFVECARCSMHLTRKQIYKSEDAVIVSKEFMEAGDVTLNFE